MQGQAAAGGRAVGSVRGPSPTEYDIALMINGEERKMRIDPRVLLRSIGPPVRSTSPADLAALDEV